MTNSILIATIIFLLIATFRKVRPTVWDRIPKPLRWAVPVALATAQDVAVALYTGSDWREAALRGVVSGLMGAGMHTGVKALPGPYKG
jgi:hypothetical protein